VFETGPLGPQTDRFRRRNAGEYHYFLRRGLEHIPASGRSVSSDLGGIVTLPDHPNSPALRVRQHKVLQTPDHRKAEPVAVPRRANTTVEGIAADESGIHRKVGPLGRVEAIDVTGRAVRKYRVTGRRMFGHVKKCGAIVRLEVGAQPAEVGLALRIRRKTIQLQHEGVGAQNQQCTGGIARCGTNPGAETTRDSQFTNTIDQMKESPDGREHQQRRPEKTVAHRVCRQEVAIHNVAHQQ